MGIDNELTIEDECRECEQLSLLTCVSIPIDTHSMNVE